MIDKSLGFVPIWRTLLSWEWYTDLKTFKLFMHLLLRANHETKKWHGIEIVTGTLISSRENLAKESGLSVQSVRTALKKL